MPKIGPTYYEVHGKGEPLFLILGFTGNISSWIPILDSLKKEFKVIIFDNQGMGKSDIPAPPYSIEMFARDLNNLQDHLKIKKAHFLGHSMGGCILQQYAISYPDFAKSIIISSSTAKLRTCTLLDFENKKKLLENGATRAELIEEFLPWIFSSKTLDNPKIIKEVLKRVKEDTTPFTLKGYLGQLAALKSFDFREKIDKVKTPTLIISGDEDITCPLTDSKFLKTRIPGSEIVIIKETGHATFVEEPKTYIDVVSSFIRNHSCQTAEKL